MILILSGPGDQHADHVEALLSGQGATFLRFDPARYPQAATLSLSLEPSGARRATLHLDGQRVDLATVRAVWFRRPGLPTAAAHLQGATRDFVQREAAGFLQDLWSTLSCRWLPARPDVVRQASLKTAQLALAGALGFELPPTLVSNDPDALLDFYRAHDGRVINKVVGPAAFNDCLGNEMVRFTERVSHRDLAATQALRACPMIFQAYVDKRVELRITVVGRQVFAAEIHSQTSAHTRLDWRRYDVGVTPHAQHQLPADVAARCVALTEQLGLRYGAIDMILTPDGRYVFVEINPNGQFLWIEHETGLPISDAICTLLMADDPAHDARARREHLGGLP